MVIYTTNMLGTLSEEERSDWKSYLGCMTRAYNCTKHASTTYSPYYLMFGRHPRLPIDVEFGLPKSNSGDDLTDSTVEPELVVENSTLDLENTGDKVIREDISLPSQFLLPNLDDLFKCLFYMLCQICHCNIIFSHVSNVNRCYYRTRKYHRGCDRWSS